MKNVSSSSGNLDKMKSWTQRPVEPEPNAVSGSVQNTRSMDVVVVVERKMLWMSCGRVRIRPHHENVDRVKFHSACVFMCVHMSIYSYYIICVFECMCICMCV